jgi:serine/threonine protein kinase
VSALEEMALCPVCEARLTQARCAACGAAARPGAYVVQRLIARTPHSRVYLAQGPGGQQVALKELLFAQVPGTQELEAFEREARLLEAISHPRIPRLLGHFQEGQGAELRLYLAAEHISGETLLERLSHHTFSEAEARDMGLQVLEILEYLHKRKPSVLHRDIKPANIIRQPDGTLFLVDFGSARESLKGATVGSTLVGTFGYMPLEQFGGTVDVTSDLYALGASLVHLLGRTPPAEHFQPDRGLDLSHLEAPVLGPWLRKLTALRPEDRYRSATLARKALEALGPKASLARPEKMSVVTISPDAPAALARLAEQSLEARDAVSRSGRRQVEKATKQAQSEARQREQQRARLEDDRLSLLDFYRMASPQLVPPQVLPWVSLLLACGVYATFPAFDLIDVPSLDSLEGLEFALALFFAACAVLGGPWLIRALRWRHAFQRLPFALEGLGRLVHRTGGDWRTFIRCSLSLRLKETDSSSVSLDTMNSVRAAALQLAVDRVNASINRIIGGSEFFRKLRWNVRENKAEGYANWRVGGQLMAVCAESLVPLQRELGLIEAVTLELSEESLSLPDRD